MTAIRSKFPRFIFGSVAKNAAPQIFTFLISAALLLQAANTNARTGEGSRVPYTTQAIMRLLQGDVPPARVATLASERDIEFDLDADLEKGFRKAGADDELIQALSKLGPRAHFKAGLAAAQNGRDHVAMVELKKATDLRPDYVEAHLALADEYKMRAPNSWIEEEYRKAVRYGGGVKARLALADHLESTDQYEKAAVEYRTLIRDRPNDSDFHIALARSLQRSNLSEAITEFKEAIRLGNKKQNTYSALATLLDKQGDHDGAIAEYREAIRLCATGSNDGGNHVRPAGASVNTKHDLPTFVPPCAADHDAVARLLEIVGKKDEAIVEYREAIRLSPESLNYHAALALALYNSHDLDGAQQEYQTLIQDDPQSAVWHNGRGVVLFVKNDVDGAIDEYKKAIQLDARYAAAHENLGNALRKRGDEKGAVVELREALRLNPQDSDLRKRLDPGASH